MTGKGARAYFLAAEARQVSRIQLQIPIYALSREIGLGYARGFRANAHNQLYGMVKRARISLECREVREIL